MGVIRPSQHAIAALRHQLDEANGRVTRVEETLTGERVRADVLRHRLESAQSELRRAQEAAVELRQAGIPSGGERRGSDSPVDPVWQVQKSQRPQTHHPLYRDLMPGAALTCQK